MILTSHFPPYFLFPSLRSAIPVKAAYLHRENLWRRVLEANKKQVPLQSYSLEVRIDSANQILKNKTAFSHSCVKPEFWRKTLQKWQYCWYFESFNFVTTLSRSSFPTVNLVFCFVLVNCENFFPTIEMKTFRLWLKNRVFFNPKTAGEGGQFTPPLPHPLWFLEKYIS